MFGDADVQLLATWQLNDRQLGDGATLAQRYSQLPELSDSERLIAHRIASARLSLLLVRATNPGRALELDDLTRGRKPVRVVSHDVSAYVHTGDMFVGHLMSEPLPASLWGQMGILTRRAGYELIDLLERRIAELGLDPLDEDALGIAMESSALEVTRMLMPALRQDARRSAERRARAA